MSSQSSEAVYVPIGKSSEGFPVYLYTDPQSKLRTYVVVLPDGRTFYSDRQGKIVSTPQDASPAVEALAILGGVIGAALGGPGGALLGGAIGVVLGQIAKRNQGRG
jgi:outer membrane lipoprotein SlyB